MRNLKMLNLTALTAMALMVFVGVGTASATELYKYTTPSANDTLGAGTKLEATLTGGTAPLTNTAGTITLETCTGGAIVANIANSGGAASTVSGAIEKFTWTGCIAPVATSTPGGTRNP